MFTERPHKVAARHHAPKKAGRDDIVMGYRGQNRRGNTNCVVRLPFQLSRPAGELLAFCLAGCGGDPDAVSEKRSGPSGDRSKRDVTTGLGGRNREEGSLFGPGGLFGSKADRTRRTIPAATASR